MKIEIALTKGLDSTEQFEDAGHSLDAREMLADYYIGDLAEEDQAQVEGGTSEGITTNQILLASAVLLIASVIFVRYSFLKAA